MMCGTIPSGWVPRSAPWAAGAGAAGLCMGGISERVMDTVKIHLTQGSAE